MEVSINTRRSQNLKDGHLTNAKNQNPDHIRELHGQAFAKSKKSNPRHEQEVNKNAQNRKRSLMSGLNPCDHHLLQPVSERPSCTVVDEKL